MAANAGSVAADTAKAVASHASGASNGSWIIEHVTDSHVLQFQPFGEIHLPQFPPVHIGGMVIDFSLTKHIVILWAAALLLIIFVKAAMKGYKDSNVPRGLARALETVVVFVRDDIVLAAIGEKGKRLLPYFLTLFFFILFANFSGLIPYSSTPTGNLSVTASLAIIAFFVIQIAGIVDHGFIGYFKGLMPPGIPLFVFPIMVIVEALGLFTKPFALAIRLFANMIAGHIVIFSLIGLIFIFHSIFVAPVSIAFAVFISLLEILIGLIQAYIFTMLTALFVGLAIHQEH
ncbi:MAG: F0F1 ATP synthase subunit A [Bacteroidetes bacterium]|nr:F0F1 ATP synthase subunit A [Bacteroidota bacterium]